jgi:hypothetical protein
MGKTIIDDNCVASLGSISSEKYSKVDVRTNINPPPINRRFFCCEKHFSELTTFLGKYTRTYS